MDDDNDDDDGCFPGSFIKFPQLEEHAPSLDRLFGGGIDHQISVPLSSVRDELIVLKAQLKAMVGQLLVQLKKLRPSTLPASVSVSKLYEEMFFKSEFPLRIVSGEQDELDTLIVGNSASGHKRLFKSRPSSQSRQRNSNVQSKQPISAVSPSAFWSFIENSGYFKEFGEEELTWLETSEKSMAAVGGGIPPLGNQEMKESSVSPNYLVERLLSSLMEESKGGDNVNLLLTNSAAAPTPRFSTTNNIITHRRKKPWEGLCERILWDLRSIGICGPITTEEEASNEICAALRKCQSELTLTTKRNEERKQRIYELLTSENYLSALEYYRVLDDLNRGIESAYSRRLASSPGSSSATSATAALVSALNKKALLMRAFNGSNFPKRSQMARPLGFTSDKGNHQHLSLLQRIAGGSHTPLARLLTSPSTSSQMQVDSISQTSKAEKRRKKKL